MIGKTARPLVIALVAVLTAPAAAQSPPGPSPKSPAAPAPPPGQTFPPGAEVLSVEGDPLGVLAQGEIRPGGERILHIRRPDGSMTTAPAIMASRGERAVVLEWTREEFESAATTASASATASPVSPTPPVI